MSEKLSTGVTITKGPMDWQIIQRDENGVGVISRKGVWSTDESKYIAQAIMVII